MIAAEEVVDFVKESTWGTDPAAGQTTAELSADAFKPSEAAETEGHEANSTFPDKTREIVVARPMTASFHTKLYATTALALMDIAFKRAAGKLDSYTWRKKKAAIEQRMYVGMMVESANLEVNKPGIVALTMEMVGKKSDTASGIAAGTYPSGTPFMSHKTLVQVNAVSVARLIRARITVDNALNQGPVGTDEEITHLEAGYRNISGEIEAIFLTNAWNALVRAGAPFAVDLDLYSGIGADQHLEIDVGGCVATGSPEEASGQGEVTRQTLSFKCEKPAAAEAIVYAMQV